MPHNFFHKAQGLLQNPIQSFRDARQPGGLLAPVTSMNQFLGDPRVNVGLAIASGNPIGDALLQSAEIQEALAPAELSDREIRLNDYMETFGVDRATAIKIDKGLLAPSTNEKGEPILIDKVANTSTPVNTISSQLNESLAISSSGEDVVANNVPKFLVNPPDVVEKAYSSGTKDDAISLAGATDIGIQAANEIAQIIANEPQLAGILGSISRTGKSLLGTISDLQSSPIVPDFVNTELLRTFANPNISRIAILEERVINAMADTAAKKGGRTPTQGLRDEQRAKLNLTGFTDSASVVERLKEIAKELNMDSMQLQTIKGGFDPTQFGNKVKDYSLDPAYNILFETKQKDNIINLGDEEFQKLLKQ